MTAPERFAESQIPLAPRAPSVAAFRIMWAMSEILRKIGSDADRTAVLFITVDGMIAVKLPNAARADGQLLHQYYLPITYILFLINVAPLAEGFPPNR
jgi:hypothetical protein